VPATRLGILCRAPTVPKLAGLMIGPPALDVAADPTTTQGDVAQELPRSTV
jgi:hypothetical protein